MVHKSTLLNPNAPAGSISGLLTNGTNTTLSGAGTTASPYAVNVTGLGTAAFKNASSTGASTIVASVGSAVTANNVPQFTDTAGTLGNSSVSITTLTGGPFLPLSGDKIVGNSDMRVNFEDTFFTIYNNLYPDGFFSVDNGGNLFFGDGTGDGNGTGCFLNDVAQTIEFGANNGVFVDQDFNVTGSTICNGPVYSTHGISSFTNLAPVNSGDFAGGVVIGDQYAGITTAPNMGLLVEGRVGIATTNITARLNLLGSASLPPIFIGAATPVGITVANTIENSGTHLFYTNNSGARFQLDQQIFLANVTGINAKTVANTSLFTVPTGKTAIVTSVVIRVTAATAITVGPSAGIGNVAGTNNIAASATMTTLQTTADDFIFIISGASKATAAAGQIYLNLGTAATGTSETIAVDLIGYLV